MSWRDYRAAPPVGTAICAETDLGAVASVSVAGPHGAFPVLLVRSPSGLRAYVNACPHQYLPLDYRSGAILSGDGSRLLCTNHGAQFDVTTGAGVAGEGLGCALDAVPVRVTEGQVVIG